MWTGPTCKGREISCFSRLSPSLSSMGYLTFSVFIKNGTHSWWLSSMPLFGGVVMDWIPPSTSLLRLITSSSRLQKFQSFLVLLQMILIEPITTERSISDNELAPLYYPGNEHNYDSTHGMLPEYYLFNHICRNTLTPKRGDRTIIRGSTRNLLLAILDGQPLPCFSAFFWSKPMFVLHHGTQYAIYAPYIQRMINFKSNKEFGYDGKHGPYQPHLVRSPAIPPPSAAAARPSSAAPASPLARRSSSAAPESSMAATHREKKQNILIKGLKTLVSICCSNDTLIYESHRQMSQRLSTLEELQREVRASMSFETPEPIYCPSLPPPIVEDPWVWYHNADVKMKTKMMMRLRKI
jgi:hypothetical protein